MRQIPRCREEREFPFWYDSQSASEVRRAGGACVPVPEIPVERKEMGRWDEEGKNRRRDGGNGVLPVVPRDGRNLDAGLGVACAGETSRTKIDRLEDVARRKSSRILLEKVVIYVRFISYLMESRERDNNIQCSVKSS